MDAKRTDEGYVVQLSRSVLKQKGRRRIRLSNTIELASEKTSLEVTNEIRQDIRDLILVMKECSTNGAPRSENIKICKRAIERFNTLQRRRVLERCTATNSSEFIKEYYKKQTIFKATLHVHESGNLYAPQYGTDWITLYEFWEANQSIFPEYLEFRRSYFTLCSSIWENIRYGLNGEQIFPKYEIHGKICKDSRGHEFLKVPDRCPYDIKSDSMMKTRYVVTQEMCRYRSGIRKSLDELIRIYSPDFEGMTARASAVDLLMFYISNNRSTDDLEDIFTYTFYEFSRFSQPELRFTRGSRAKQTRHVAWCLHEYRRNCMFLDRECHSAVSCPFYQERSNNRN